MVIFYLKSLGELQAIGLSVNQLRSDSDAHPKGGWFSPISQSSCLAKLSRALNHSDNATRGETRRRGYLLAMTAVAYCLLSHLFPFFRGGSGMKGIHVTAQ